MTDLLEVVDDERILHKTLKQYFSVYNHTLLIKCIDEKDDIDKMQEFKYFKRDLFNLYERKILKIQSKCIVIRNRDLINKLNLDIGETYILRNDISEKFSEYQNVIESYFGMIEIQNLRKKLESMTQFQERWKGQKEEVRTLETQARDTKDREEQEEINKKIKQARIEDQRRLLTCFSFPQVCLIQKSNTGEVGSFFKRLSFQKEKQVVSLYLDRRDNNRLEKIQLLVRL